MSDPRHKGQSSAAAARPALTLRRAPVWRYGAAVGLVLLATLLTFGTERVVGEHVRPPFAFFYAAVLVATIYGGRRPGLLSIILCGLSTNYFFLPPRFSLAVGLDALSQLSVFLLVAFVIHSLTERHQRAQASAVKSEEWLVTTLKSIGDAVIATDRNGRVTFMNPVAQALTGWGEAEAHGRALQEVFHIVNEATRATVENPVDKVLREGSVIGLANHTILMRRDGTELPIDDSGAPILDARGEITGVVLVFRDTTERKHAEEERLRLAAIIESSDDAIIGKTLEGVVTSWNVGAERIYGYTAAEAAGQHISFIVPPELAEETSSILERIRDGRKVEHLETTRISRDGRRLNVSVTISPIKNSAGSIIGASAIARDITERRHAEAALRESEERYRTLAETASDAIITIDESSTILFVNPSVEKIFGYTNAEMVGQSLTMLMPEYLRHVHREGLARYRETGRRHISWEGVELPGLHRSGAEIPLELSFGEFHREGRHFFTGIVRDVSERKRAEESLRESEIRYRHLADAMPQIVWTARADGYMDYYNTRWFEYTGLALEQTRGWGWQHVVHPDDLERCVRSWAVAVARGRNYSVECRFRRASDRTYRWHLTRAEPMRDREGNIIRWFGTATDIQDRKQTEETINFLAEASALLASTLDYETILEQLARLSVSTFADYCLIDVIGDDGRVRRVATAHREPSKEEEVRALRQYPPDPGGLEGIAKVLRTGAPVVMTEITGERLREITRDEAHERLILRLGLKSFMTVPLLTRQRTVGALTFASVAVSRHYSGADLSFAEELARRAALAIENARLYRHAQEANKAKDEFLATLSHELRTPLTPIIGWVHMLRSGRLPELEVAHGLQIIEKNSQALTRLINDLLDMSSIMSGKMRIEHAPVEIAAAIREAVETVRVEAEERGVRIETVDCEGVEGLTVSGDRSRLVQVFWNLLNNAVRFSDEGGRVRVECVRGDGREVRVEVSDEGAGIPAEFQPYVFERFRQADGSTTRTHGGLGIGLALVKSLVEAHGGTTGVESAGRGLGSRFNVTLPLAGAPDAARVPHEGGRRTGLTTSVGAAARVLIVEDARDTLEMLKVVFEVRGFAVTGCESADEALRIASSLWFDIVVSDIGLPRTDGYELIKRLREIPHLRDIPAVALTGYAAQKDADSALAAGFDMHIPKPVDPAVLSSAVEQLLREKAGREKSEA
jgi:PAS domain S-box-containing protein